VNTGSNGTTGQVRRVLGALLVGLIRKWILLPGNGEATLAATTHTSLSAVTDDDQAAGGDQLP
jgi:hypothetical protein